MGDILLLNRVKDILSRFENPFSTTQGQIVISQSESYQARQLREGTLKIAPYVQTNPTGGVYGTAYSTTAGFMAQIQKICLSTTSATSVSCSIRITQGVVGESTKEFSQVIGANSSVVFDIPISLGTGGKIEFRSNAALTGLLVCSYVVVEKPLV